jgi:uncharacterized protein (TIGR03435 family)
MRTRLLLLTLIAGLASAQAPSAAPPTATTRPLTFDVVSIKPAKPGENWHHGFGPTGYSAAAVSLRTLAYHAYFAMNMSAKDPFVGVPGWASNDLWDIEAKVAPEDMAAFRNDRVGHDSPDSVGKQMLRSMLADRFHLVVHRVPAEVDGYALTVAKNGPRLTEAAPGEPQPSGSIPLPGGGYMVPYGNRNEAPHVTYYFATMADFATRLRGMAGGPVVDRTGLTARYDFTLNWLSSDPDEKRPGLVDLDDPDKLSHWNLRALGLHADHVKLPIEQIVIDSVSRPSEN